MVAPCVVRCLQEAGLGLGGINIKASRMMLIPRNETACPGVEVELVTLSDSRSYLRPDARSDFDRCLAVPEAIRTPVRIAVVKHVGLTTVNSTLNSS